MSQKFKLILLCLCGVVSFSVIVTLASATSCEEGACSTKKAPSLYNSWQLLEVIKHPPEETDKVGSYPESITIENQGIVYIKLPYRSQALSYGFVDSGVITSTKNQLYDKVPNQEPYTLITRSVVSFNGDFLHIDFTWTKKNQKGQVEYKVPGSYRMELQGKRLLFTRTLDEDNPAENRTQLIYQAIYTQGE